MLSNSNHLRRPILGSHMALKYYSMGSSRVLLFSQKCHPQLILSRPPSSSDAVGAGVATSEGIAGETDGDSRDHSGDVGVPTGNGGVWAGELTRGMSHSISM
ncbi:hypothetical protein Tco_0071554 [Tanacetum coccineum]